MNIIEKFNNAVIFRYDYCDDVYTVTNVNNCFDGPYKLKILDEKGIDLCKYNKSFISDINLSQPQNHFIENIKIDCLDRTEMTKYCKYARGYFNSKNMTLCDYTNEDNWALTYQLRGYNVHFDHIVNDDMKNIDKKYNNVKLITKILKKQYRYDSEEEDYEVEEEEEEDGYEEEFEDGNDINDETEIKNGDVKNKYEDDIKKEENNIEKENGQILQKFLKNAGNVLYIEYDFHAMCVYTVKESKIKESTIYDLWNNDIKLATIIVLSNCTSPNLTDFDIHSDEGAYHCGANFYKYGSYFEGDKKKTSDGIVLIGEQNSDVMYYGNAINEDVLIPDIVHLENESVH